MQRAKLAIVILVGLVVFGCAGSAMAQETSKTKARAEKTEEKSKMENPVVVMATTMGDIRIELYPGKAPITVENFLSYVREGYYDGLIFHRVISNFMIQGGGFTSDMVQKKTRDMIKNEADNGLKNDRGTIAMARTSAVNSATSQFFINVANNNSLNHRDKSQRGYGYCVFGKVVDGLDTVDKIRYVKTTTARGHGDVPVKEVIIKRAYVEGEKKAKEKVKGKAEASAKTEMKTKEKLEQKK